jgi:hypothetical protein
LFEKKLRSGWSEIGFVFSKLPVSHKDTKTRIDTFAFDTCPATPQKQFSRGGLALFFRKRSPDSE